MANDIEHLFTRVEAANFMSRAPVGTRFAVSIRIDLPCGEDKFFRDAGATYVNLSRKDAKKICLELMSDTLEERGARIPVRVHSYKVLDEERVTYWIG